MKKFVVTTENKQQYNALMDWSAKNGYKWINGQIGSDYPYEKAIPEAERIIFKEDGRMSCNRAIDIQKTNGPVISFEAFAAIQGIELGPEPLTLRLSDKYEAVIDYTSQTVTVGCQVIPFTKVNEIHTGTKKHSVPEKIQAGGDFVTRKLIHEALPTPGYSGNRAAYIAEELNKAGYKVVKQSEDKPVMPEAVPQSECDAWLRNAVEYAMPMGASSSQKQAVVDYLTKYGFKVVKA